MPDENRQKTVSSIGRFLLGVYLAVNTAGLAYFIAKLWPAVPVESPSTQAAAPVANAGGSGGSNALAAGNTGAAQDSPKAPEDKTGSGQAAAPKRATTPSDHKTVDNRGMETTKPEEKRSEPPPAESKTRSSDAASGAQKDNRRTVRLFWGIIEFSMTGEIRLILLALAMGALGGCVHGATSFVGYVGNGKLYSSWIWYYVMRAPISAALALITYFVVRGGFFTPASNTAAAAVNDFGIAAVSGLVGMFSKQATAKLDEVFTALFRTAKPEDLGDKMANRVPVLTAVNPAMIAHGSGDTTITVTGDGFVGKSEVRWAGVHLATTLENATQLTAIVPAAKLASEGSFDVTVFSPAPGGGTSPALNVTVRRMPA
jgi:hypothetical protein